MALSDTNPLCHCTHLATVLQETATAHPHRTALVWEGGEVSYGALLALVEALRVPLRGRPEPLIGILAHKSPVTYAAVQAILAEGRAYTPMSPAFPAVRNAFIASKANLRTLVAGDECAPALCELLAVAPGPWTVVCAHDAVEVPAACAGRPGVELVRAGPPVAGPPQPVVPPAADGNSYVVFTSGSTGVPKGVRAAHAHVISYLRSFLAEYPLVATDRVSQTYDMTFDPSVHDQFTTWASGATLVVLSDRALKSPLQWARQQQLTVWFSVPSLVNYVASTHQDEADALPDVRLSLFCGERLTPQTTQTWRKVAPKSVQVNLYGPTETTILITHFAVPDGWPEARMAQGGFPIGRPFPSQRAVVCAPDGTPEPIGTKGELWLTGDQVALGYLDDPERTRERFVEHDGAVWYRTGDWVVQDPDGLLQYHGRLDHQIKLMGYRVELGEIEHALMKAAAAPFSLAAVARLRGDSASEELFGLLPAACAERKRQIRTQLRSLLPAWMVPRKLYFSDDVPLNTAGKIDRAAVLAKVAAGAYE